MTIALTTPTGNIGSKVLANLLREESAEIRVLVRDPARLPSTAHERMEIVQGSLESPEDLDHLLRGADALFWCQPDTPTAPDYVAAYEALARLGAGAIQRAGVARVVAISAAGEPGDIPAGPITALHRMEQIFSETDAAIRFLRCGSFFENLLWQWDLILSQGFFTYSAPGDIPGPQVATADIAQVAAGLLADADWSGQKSIPLLGPEDLSYDAMASLLSEAVGRSVRYQVTPPADYIAAMQSLGHSESAARGLVAMFDFLANHYTAPTDTDRSLTPTSLSDWLKRGE